MCEALQTTPTPYTKVCNINQKNLTRTVLQARLSSTNSKPAKLTETTMPENKEDLPTRLKRAALFNKEQRDRLPKNHQPPAKQTVKVLPHGKDQKRNPPQLKNGKAEKPENEDG